MSRTSVSFGLLLALTGLAAAGRMVFVGLPNVAPTYFIVFVAGVAWGVRTGAAVGLLSMVVTDVLLSGLHPTILVNSPAMALLGVLGGLLGRVVNFGQRGDESRVFAAALAGSVGVLATVLFSVSADAISYLLFYRSGFAALVALVVAGLVFNVFASFTNAVLFGTATYPVLRALRQAGYLRRPGQGPSQAADQAHTTTSPSSRG